VYHCDVVAPLLQPPRWIHARGAAGAVAIVPWLEVSALVHVRVASWRHEDRLWVHWAVPCVGGAPRVEAARPFDPGRRAGSTVEPPSARRIDAAPADREVVDAAARLFGGWRPQLHRQPALELVSRPGENQEDFRRRCLAVFGPAVRSGQLPGADAQKSVAEVAAGIETRTLGPAEVEAESLQARVAWYPEGDEPALAGSDLLITGAARRAT
jgi:hypothetical protein